MRMNAAFLTAISLVACSGISQDQERQVGAQDAAWINSQLPLIQDTTVTDYIVALGRRMAATTSRADLDWHFYVVNSADANAFALPGGYVYVNRGLIDLTQNEAELAGAMGHEIGHVVERHAIKQMEQQQGANVGISALCSLTNLCSNGTGRAVLAVGGSAAFAHYSRKDESEADSEAIVNTIRAGIDPRGVPSLFQRLLQMRQTSPTLVDNWFADHPLEEARIRHTDGLIAALNPSQLQGLERDSPAYHAMKQSLDAMPPPPTPHPADSAGDSGTINRQQWIGR